MYSRIKGRLIGLSLAGSLIAVTLAGCSSMSPMIGTNPPSAPTAAADPPAAPAIAPKPASQAKAITRPPLVQDCGIVTVSTPTKYACNGKVYTAYDLTRMREEWNKYVASGH